MSYCTVAKVEVMMFFFFSVSNSLFVKVISLDSVIAKDEGTDPDYQEERDW